MAWEEHVGSFVWGKRVFTETVLLERLISQPRCDCVQHYRYCLGLLGWDLKSKRCSGLVEQTPMMILLDRRECNYYFALIEVQAGYTP